MNISQFSTKQKNEILEFLSNNEDMIIFGTKSALSKILNMDSEFKFANMEEINPIGILEGKDLFELPSISDLNSESDNMVWIAPKQDKPLMVKLEDKKFKFTLDSK